MASGYAIAAGGTHVSTVENNGVSKCHFVKSFIWTWDYFSVWSKNAHPANIPDWGGA